MNSSSTDRSEVRRFGLIALIFFGSLSAVGVWREKHLLALFFGFLSLLGLGFIVMPGILGGVYLAWRNIAHFFGRVVTIVLLILAYYLVITPSALLKRLFGGTPLRLKADKKVSSYWVARSEPAQSRDRFLKRY